jgi:hypothetical protein
LSLERHPAWRGIAVHKFVHRIMKKIITPAQILTKLVQLCTFAPTSPNFRWEKRHPRDETAGCFHYPKVLQKMKFSRGGAKLPGGDPDSSGRFKSLHKPMKTPRLPMARSNIPEGRNEAPRAESGLQTPNHFRKVFQKRRLLFETRT